MDCGCQRPSAATAGTRAGSGDPSNKTAPTVDNATAVAVTVMAHVAARGANRFTPSRLTATTRTDSANGA